MIKFALPLIFLILFIPISADVDLSISHYFFKDGSFSTFWLWSFIYNYGLIPGQVASVFACFILIASYFCKRFFPYRKISLLFVLTLALGSGLIVHALLKDNFGRPRPRQVVEFGGTYPFFPFYKPNFLGSKVILHSNDEKLRSFSCGHCSMGFLFFALALGLKRLNFKRLSLFIFAFALFLGILLSIARIAVGGHFFSDTLVSLIVMWYVAILLDAFLFRSKRLAHLDP